jgi:hypothetical protein
MCVGADAIASEMIQDSNDNLHLMWLLMTDHYISSAWISQ